MINSQNIINKLGVCQNSPKIYIFFWSFNKLAVFHSKIPQN